MFLLIFLLCQSLLVKINPIRQERALNVETCKNKSGNLWMVSILRDGKHACNGVIMAENAILTTALCCIEKLNCSRTGPNSHVRVVHHYELLNGEEQSTIIAASYCVIHPNYVKKEYYIENNAAIVVLNNKLSPFEVAPFIEEFKLNEDFYEVCTKGMVMGRWYHYEQEQPNSELECFPATVKDLGNCADITNMLYSRRSKDLTLTCSFDASNRHEVCRGFYGAALMCGGKVVGLISHKFNFSEQCEQVSPFYYTRIDWTLCFRIQWYLDNKEDLKNLRKFQHLCGKEFGGRSRIDRSHQNNSGNLVSAAFMKHCLYIFLLLNHIIRTSNIVIIK